MKRQDGLVAAKRVCSSKDCDSREFCGNFRRLLHVSRASRPFCSTASRDSVFARGDFSPKGSKEFRFPHFSDERDPSMPLFRPAVDKICGNRNFFDGLWLLSARFRRRSFIGRCLYLRFLKIAFFEAAIFGLNRLQKYRFSQFLSTGRPKSGIGPFRRQRNGKRGRNSAPSPCCPSPHHPAPHRPIAPAPHHPAPYHPVAHRPIVPSSIAPRVGAAALASRTGAPAVASRAGSRTHIHARGQPGRGIARARRRTPAVSSTMVARVSMAQEPTSCREELPPCLTRGRAPTTAPSSGW